MEDFNKATFWESSFFSGFTEGGIIITFTVVMVNKIISFSYINVGVV